MFGSPVVTMYTITHTTKNLSISSGVFPNSSSRTGEFVICATCQTLYERPQQQDTRHGLGIREVWWGSVRERDP
jgi:hypothetical protein